MPEITKLYQDDLEQQIKNGIQRLGQVCKEPALLTQADALSHELLIKFIEHCDNARLLQNQPKENVSL